MTDLLETFLPRFLETAGGRVARMEQELGAAEPRVTLIVHEMHAVAGEAGLIGLPELAHLAREGEKVARRSWDDDARARVTELVGELRRGLDRLATEGPP